MTNPEARLRQCFSAVFPGLAEADIPRADLFSVGEWDSVASINLVMVIEQEFGIEIPADQLEQMSSFETIATYLGKNR